MHLEPISNSDKFSLLHCPKNKLERKEIEKYPYALDVESLMYE